jgi:hypothetical protein
MTRDGFEKVIALLEGAFRQTLTAKERDAYWMLWLDQDDETTMRAAVAYARNPERSRYGFPKPGDLLANTAVELELEAEAALSLLIERADFRESTVFEDLAIHAAVERMGGYIQCCKVIRDMPDKDFRFWKKDWLTSYKAARTYGHGNAPDRLIGAYEQNNAERWPDNVPETRHIACDYLGSDLTLPEGPVTRSLLTSSQATDPVATDNDPADLVP